jgi:hypothetical protein
MEVKVVAASFDEVGLCRIWRITFASFEYQFIVVESGFALASATP